MGRTVRNVFSKSRSRHDSHASSGGGAKKRKWSSSVRSYLCGDEYNSVAAAEGSASFRCSTVADVDLASFASNGATDSSTNRGDVAYAGEDTVSVRSSDATVDQPLRTDSKEENRREKVNSAYKLFRQDDAALIIQSAFRSFLARRERGQGQGRGRESEEEKQGSGGSPSRESIGTSVEVQTGNSSDIFSIKEESCNLPHKIRHRNRAQVLKIQEDWDDSTVSSMISKMRIQNKLEAATRRERALAYAFSQQLRLCSRKKQCSTNGDETNAGWSWLERWMAARQPEFTAPTEDGGHKALVRKRAVDAAVEEKESCGSNELSSLIEVANLLAPKHVPRPPGNRSKPRRCFSGQDSAAAGESKVVQKVEEERKRQKQGGNKRDVTAHQVPLQGNDF